MLSKEVGWKIGKIFVHCLNVIIPENGSKQGRLMKVLAEIELKKPLMRGTKLKLEDELIWVDFTYEKIPTFCFYCGIIGHQEKNCGQKIEDADKQNIVEGQYGEWLRVQRDWEGPKTVKAELPKSALVSLVKPAQRGEGNGEEGVITGRGDRGDTQNDNRVIEGVKKQEGTRARDAENSNVSLGGGRLFKKQ